MSKKKEKRKKEVEDEEEYVVEFEYPAGEWTPVAGAIYKDKKSAEARSELEAKEMGVITRVSSILPLWKEWNLFKLAGRLGGTTPAIRELKKRGDAGAITAWAIYKQHVKNLINLACGGGADGAFAREPAYRTTLISDLEAVGEDELIKQIDGLWRKYPKAIPTSDILDLQDDWDDNLEQRVGRRIPKTPAELTKEDVDDSKRISRELHVAKVKKTPKEKLDDLEDMKKEIERKMEKLKKELK